MNLQEEVTKMRKDFKSKTSTLRKQIDNKKQKIEQEQKTLRNHQKKYDEQLEEYKNDVNKLITKLALKDNIDQSKLKSIYQYLMTGSSKTDEMQSSVTSDETSVSSSDNVTQHYTSERSDNQN
ncbi:hypothetical protein ATN85_10350 [Staphylococcus hominis]|uniref:hypothetical protein n=1 Tax=Staphylococcus hominis TaxID=1290 RepID=UPI0009A26A7F|nr:hypothetical protein [Staphylococcus hominis]OPF66058.1 hypothetical protein ATN85_10350 [Staphylococcus hominis]